MCHLGVNQLITVYHFNLLCAMDESTSRFRIPTWNFWRGKDVYYQFCSEIYGLQEQMDDTDFSRISGHLNIVSKSLKIFIQFFIGYPNTCTWCGIQAVICSWLYELLMSLRKLFPSLKLVFPFRERARPGVHHQECMSLYLSVSRQIHNPSKF